MGDMSVPGFYFEKAGASVYALSSTVDATDYSDIIATPASGKYLVITHIIVQPTVVLTNGGVTIKSYDSGGSPKDTLFEAIGCTTVIIAPIVIDMSGCPIVLGVGESLRAKVANASDNAQVMCRGFQI
jgi:hypothetical protein